MHEESFPFITLPNWVKAASQCGFNIEPILRRHGIDTTALSLQQIRVTEASVDSLMAECVGQSRHQYFPFVLGETFAFEYLSELETFVTTSRTLREATRVFIWLRRFVIPLLDVQLLEDTEFAHLVVSGVAGRPVHQYNAEALFASTLKFARLLFGTPPAFHHIGFSAPGPTPGVDYTGLLGMPVRFGQWRDEICFDRQLLDQPLKGDFPALHREAEQRIHERLREVEAPDSTADAVRQLLSRQPRLFGRGVDRIAAELGLHPRTLQRRLRDEGCSFFELQDQARYRSAALALDQGERDLDALSERLGFSDRRSFTRAFKRWSGVSPRVYRDQHQSVQQG